MGWSIETGAAGGGSLSVPAGSFPLYFVKRLNGVGFHSCLINDPSSKPSNGDLVRFVWDRGSGNETLHFEGFVTDVRRWEETNSFLCRGLDLNGLLFQSTTGAIRKYLSTTPFDILQQSGTPNGLIFNSQGNRKPIGSTTVQYGADNTKPNQIDSDTTGDSLDFRTDSGRSWVNIQRLLLQARATGEYPTWVSAGDDFGLEAYVELTGANNDEPRLFVVTRREPSANASPTTITYPKGFQDFRRGSEGLTASDTIQVVGSGSGQNRVQESFVGSGGIEGVVTDKTILSSTPADNQANRLSTLLDPDTDVITTITGEHFREWTPGHRYTLGFPNLSDVTQRLFTVAWDIRNPGFKIVFGRPRPLPNDPFASVQNLAGGHAQGTQIMDGIPVNNSQPSKTNSSNVADGTTKSTTLSFSNQVFDADFHETLMLYVQIPWSDADETVATFDVLINRDSSSDTTPWYHKRVTSAGDNTVEFPLYYIADWVRAIVGNGELDDLDLRVTNRTGAELDTMNVQLSAWVQA